MAYDQHDSAANIPAGAWRRPRNTVEGAERWASLLTGALLGAWGLRRGGLLGAGLATAGTALLARGAAGVDPVLGALQSRPAAQAVAKEQGWAGAAVAQRALTMQAPRTEVYAAWRDFERFPRFMENILRVEPSEDGKRSHWVGRAGNGQTLEWDAELTADDPGRRLAWRSTPESSVQHAGEIEFRDAPGGRGCEVHATITYEAPLGPLGRLAALALQREPGVQAQRDLRRFKQFMETGEVATAEPPHAAPRGGS